MDNLTIFDCLYPPYKITKPIRLIELFAGIGSQAKALENIGVEFEHYRVVEFDKYAISSYNVIHNTNFALTDITKINGEYLGITDTDTYEYIMTYSFPCQDLSIAGKQRGMGKETNTRSGLLWQVERLLNETKELPQILLMENVPEVIGSKNIKDFQLWEKFLENKDYKNYLKILNAKDYGIPQNRRRCFMISILGNYTYTFPQKQPLKLCLKDMLEDNPDPKYYLTDKQLESLVIYNKKHEERGNGFRFDITDTNSIAKTITTRPGSRQTDNYIKAYGYLSNVIFRCNRDIYDISGISPTLTCGGGGGVMPKIKENAIRTLTPLECWRLMGFTDDDFEKVRNLSDTQLYKQAGNSIVVNVLEALFRQLF